MKAYFRVQIPIMTTLIGLCIGVVVFGMIVHESSHALACIFLKVPFTYSIFQVNTVPLTGITAIFMGLSGGIAELFVSLLAFWLVTFLEKRGLNWFLGAIGFEIAFLTMVFLGVINSLWEGLFYDSYQLVYNNPPFLLVLFLLTFGISFIVVKKWKFKKLAPKTTKEKFD